VSVASAQTFPVERERRELSLAVAAMRGRLALVALLFALAAAAWWISAVRMGGMNAGMTAMGRSGTGAIHPHAMGSMGGHAMGSMSGRAMAGQLGNELGTLGWFVVTWIVMMAAMMFPSLAPTVALYARVTRKRGSDRALLFAGGYLLVWGIAGAVAYGLFEAGRSLFGRDLAFDRAGGAVAAGVVALAALYQFTPLKNACLARCRGPLGFILGCWREGRAGALEMGARHAFWCLGCCWALMAALFALGIMSLAWMAAVAALIALEKTLPWRRIAMGATSLVLVGLAGALLAGSL
jgi:predicted metal-binding membrane protein